MRCSKSGRLTPAAATSINTSPSPGRGTGPVAKIPEAFDRLEKALEKQGSGPFFNGAKYSLVDSAYAPFLQRYVFLDRIKKLGVMEKYPRLKAWCDALMARPSTHSFPEAEFEAMYREGLRKRGSYLSQFVEAPRAAAE